MKEIPSWQSPRAVSNAIEKHTEVIFQPVASRI